MGGGARGRRAHGDGGAGGVRFVACASRPPRAASSDFVRSRPGSAASAAAGRRAAADGLMPSSSAPQMRGQPSTVGAKTNSHNHGSSSPWWASLPPHPIVPLTGPMLLPRATAEAPPPASVTTRAQRLVYVPVQMGANAVFLEPRVLLEHEKLL